MATTYDFNSLSPYRYVSSRGVVIPDTSQIHDGVIEMFKSIFGQNIDTTPETIIGRLIEAFTVFLRDTVGITAQNACQYNVNVATGIYLDALGALFGVARNASTRSSVNVTMTVDPEVTTAIPAGTVFATRSGDAFYLQSDATVEEGESTVTGTALSMNYGPVECIAHDMISIVSSVSGLISVYNELDATLGSLGESDDSYRRRIISSIGGFGGMVPAVYKELYNATYDDNGTVKKSISHALVLNNGDGIAVNERGVTLAPHSIFVCVDGPSDYATNSAWQQSIADAVAKSKSLGCDMTSISDGNTISKAASSDLGGITVKFYPAKKTSLNIVSSWASPMGLPSDLQSRMKEILEGFGIGATITREQVFNALALAYPARIVDSVRINPTESNPQGDDSVSLNGYEIGTVS